MNRRFVNDGKVSLKTYIITMGLMTLIALCGLVYVRSTAYIGGQSEFWNNPPFGDSKFLCTNFNSTHYAARNSTTGNFSYLSTNGTATINYATTHLTANRQGQEEILVTGDWTLDGSIVLYNYTKLTLNAHLTETKGAHSAIVIEGTAANHKQYITVSGGNITCITSTYEGLDVSYADYITVEDMRIIGANGGNRDGIRVSYTTQSTFRHNYVKHNDYEWYITDGTQNCRFEGNYAVQLTAQSTVSLWRIACYGSTANVSGNDFIGNWAIGTYGADCDNGFYLRSYADNAQVVRNSFMDNHAVNITGTGRGGFKLNPACYNTFVNNHCENVEAGYRFEVNQDTTLTVERSSWNNIVGGQVKLYHNDGGGSNKGVVFSAQDPNAQVCHNTVEGLSVVSGNGSKTDYGIYFLSDSGAGQIIDHNSVHDCTYVTCDYATGWELVPSTDANYNEFSDNDWSSCSAIERIILGTTTGTNTVWTGNIGVGGEPVRPQVSEASYIVSKYNSTYYFAQNGTTGRYDYLSSNASYVIESAIDNLPSTGGTISLKSGTYEGWVVIDRDGVTLEGEGVFCDVPTGIPDNPPTLLIGTVLKVTIAGKDAISIVGQHYGIHIRDLGVWFTNSSTGCGITTDTTQTYTLTHCSFSNLKFLNCDKDSYALRFANFLDLDINNVMAWGGPLLNIYANKPNFQQGNSILSNLFGHIKYDLSPVGFTTGPYPVWIHRNDSISPSTSWTNLLTVNRLQISNPAGSVDTDYYSVVCWDLRSSTITGLDVEESNCQNHTLLLGSCRDVTFQTPYLWEQSPNHAYVEVASNNKYVTFVGGYIEGVLDSSFTDKYIGTQIGGPIDSTCACAFPDLENNTGIATLTSGQSSVTVTARYIGLYDYVLLTIIEATGLTAGESLKVDTINRAPTNTFVVTCDDEGTASQDIVFFWKVVHNDAAP